MSKVKQIRELSTSTHPPLNWITGIKSSSGSLKYSSSSLIEAFSFLRHRAVKDFDASSSWPSDPRAGWSAILRQGCSCEFELLLQAFYPASVRVSLFMKNLPRWHCERVSIFVQLHGVVPLFLLHAHNWWWKLNHRYSHYWLVIQ